MKRTLVLRSEQLAELSTSELADIAGGATQPGGSCDCPSYSWYCTPALIRDSRIVCS